MLADPSGAPSELRLLYLSLRAGREELRVFKKRRVPLYLAESVASKFLTGHAEGHVFKRCSVIAQRCSISETMRSTSG